MLDFNFFGVMIFKKLEGDDNISLEILIRDLHKSGYDFQKLKELVEQHKFRDINKIKKPDESTR